MPVVGGDGIGLRPVDFHRDALTAMGAHVAVDGDGISAQGALRAAPTSCCRTPASGPPRRCCWPRC